MIKHWITNQVVGNVSHRTCRREDRLPLPGSAAFPTTPENAINSSQEVRSQTLTPARTAEPAGLARLHTPWPAEGNLMVTELDDNRKTPPQQSVGAAPCAVPRRETDVAGVGEPPWGPPLHGRGFVVAYASP